jgi:hypothetical protein
MNAINSPLVTRRRLVVVAKAVAVVADFVEPFLERDPRQLGRIGRHVRRQVAVGGPQRVDGEDVLDVRHEQFLMLLLVVQADLDQRTERRHELGVGRRQQLLHVVVHVGAVVVHLLHRGARDVAALVAAVALARLDVVRVEQVGVLLVKRRIVGRVLAEDERLEEPADMRQVPLRGANVGHRLDDVVFRLQRLTKMLGELPHATIAIDERGRRGRDGGGSRGGRIDRHGRVGKSRTTGCDKARRGAVERAA